MNSTIASRAGLSWFALGVSAVITVFISLIWRNLEVGSAVSADTRVYLFAAVALGFGGSVWTFLGSRPLAIRLTFLARLALLLLIARSHPIGLVPVVLLAIPFVLDVGISEEYPGNLFANLAAAILIAVVLHTPATDRGPVVDRLTFLLVTGIAATVFSLATKYREDLIREQQHADRLDSALVRLAEVNIGYQEYVSRAERASMLEERKRITRDIHDTIGYTMTNNIMMMEAAAEMVRHDPAGVERLMQQARESAQEGLDEIRNSLHLLRAQEDPAPTSVDAIVKMITAFRDATGTEVELELGNTPIRLNPDIESAVYHLVREALTNSFRHGKATRVRVQFWETDSALTVVVWDNGIGAGDHIHEGIGLSGMRERLRSVSGTLTVEPLPEGFQIVATIAEPAGSDGR